MTVNNNKNKHIRTWTRLTWTQRSDWLERLIEVNDNWSIYVALDWWSISQWWSWSSETIKDWLDTSEKIDEINESLKEIKNKDTISNTLREEFFIKLKEIVQTIESNSWTSFEIDYNVLKEVIKNWNIDSIVESWLINLISQLKLNLNNIISKEQWDSLFLELQKLNNKKDPSFLLSILNEINDKLISLNNKEEKDYTNSLNEIINWIKQIQFTANVELDSSSIVKVEEAQKASNAILSNLSDKITELNFILANNQWWWNWWSSQDYSLYLKKLVNRLTPIEQKWYYKKFKINVNSSEEKRYRFYFDKNNDVPFSKQYRNIKIDFSWFVVQAHSWYNRLQFEPKSLWSFIDEWNFITSFKEWTDFDQTFYDTFWKNERKQFTDELWYTSYEVPPKTSWNNKDLETNSYEFNDSVLNWQVLEICLFPKYTWNWCYFNLEFEAFELYEEYRKEV